MGVPLYVFVRGDTLGLVVLANEQEPVAELAQRLSRAAAPRVTLTGRLHVVHRGRRVPGDSTLAEAGIGPLDRVDLEAEGGDV